MTDAEKSLKCQTRLRQIRSIIRDVKESCATRPVHKLVVLQKIRLTVISDYLDSAHTVINHAIQILVC